MPTMDQVAWANCNVHTEGETQPFARGSLLPEAEGPEEMSERSLLRMIGAIRTVEVVYTPDELAAKVTANAEATAAATSAHDVDPARPLGEQTAGEAAPGPPTVQGTHGGPVVIGPEDTKPGARKTPAAKETPDKPAARPSGTGGKA